MFCNTRATMYADGKAGEVKVMFEWSDSNPLAIKAHFQDGVTWTFGLDLLREGGGIGDVRVVRHPSRAIFITLDSGTRTASFLFEGEPLSDYIKAIPNVEMIITDEQILSLLESAE